MCYFEVFFNIIKYVMLWWLVEFIMVYFVRDLIWGLSLFLKYWGIWLVLWICEVFGVLCSGFYVWLVWVFSKCVCSDEEFGVRVCVNFIFSYCIYGVWCVWYDFLVEGFLCGLYCIEWLMCVYGLRVCLWCCGLVKDDGLWLVIVDNIFDC